MMKISWNGFLKHAVQQYPKEACAFLFSNRPYHPDEEWHVFTVGNVSLTPETNWNPDAKDMQRAKQKAVRLGLTKIGNVHSHPVKSSDDIEQYLIPSDLDLVFARKFNDVIRVILAVGPDAVFGASLHDKYGVKIPIILSEVKS
jgi:proteasome lid subunit RPN8/RPN11